MIINLTQHDPTPAQAAEGVGKPLEGARELLDFDRPGICVTTRAMDLTALVIGETKVIPAVGTGPKVMIGGIPRLMGPLERHLTVAGFSPVYAFSRRECIEKDLGFETFCADTSDPEDFILETESFTAPSSAFLNGREMEQWAGEANIAGERFVWSNASREKEHKEFGYPARIAKLMEGRARHKGVSKNYVFSHLGFDDGSYQFVEVEEYGHSKDTLLRQSYVDRYAHRCFTEKQRGEIGYLNLPAYESQFTWHPDSSWRTEPVAEPSEASPTSGTSC